MEATTRSRSASRSKGGDAPSRAERPARGGVPGQRNWRTSDEDEINRRRLRSVQERFEIRNTTPQEKIFSSFTVRSGSGVTYAVEIRDIAQRHLSCTCPDFRTNGLASCKHVEAVLGHLEARFPRLFERAVRDGSARTDIVVDPARETLLVERGIRHLPPSPRALFTAEGLLRPGTEPEEAYETLRRIPANGLRLSQDIEPWLTHRRYAADRRLLRREYEQKVRSGDFPAHETLLPLYPYQREGMLHLAFTERALLADEMGLGKTAQVVAACALLRRLGQARRALVVCPASLKTEWEEQIQRFTDLPYQVVFGPRRQRLLWYASDPPFFTIVNYEQVRSDALEINERLAPDVVILDEAQRIKNWSTKTAQAAKRLRSRYAFVLTGTPIENRIDELYSIVDFLDPAVFGPLFRFNREFYELDEQGRPAEYRNLEGLHERIRPLMIRRRKADVETQLPGRVDRNFFVPLSPGQRATYAEHEMPVARLIQTAKRRPLTRQEQEKLMRELAMMRMICDTNYILDPADRTCPKLGELEKILDEALSDPDVKVVLFSEWVRMLELVKGLCEKLKHGYAWHTGSVPQRRRRAEIQRFKTDPLCRVFLCSESGGVGLNLQAAGMVINCDLPWNPAKLEQRIARVWRKHQTRTVDVINLISEDTIEHRMLYTLAAKQGLADGVLDRKGDLSEIRMRGGAQTFFEKLELVLERSPGPGVPVPAREMLPVDRSAAWALKVQELAKGGLVACEERYPVAGEHSVLIAVVDRDADTWRETLRPVHESLFGPGRCDPLSPVRFEVIDRATHEALKRLEASGLVASTVRATRPLFPAPENGKGLSGEQRAEVDALREQAARKVKMARLLLAGDMHEEARPAILEAITLQGRRLAVENRLPVPESPEEALAPPLVPFWKPSAELPRRFILGEPADLPGVLALLGDCTDG